MANLIQSIQKYFTPAQTIPAGIYHYQAPPEDPRNYRLHLRLEPNGEGLLIVNAATVLHLNQTAAEYAYYLIQKLSPAQAADKVARRYRVPRQQAQKDYQDFIDRIETLISTPDLDPVTFLDFDRHTPYSGEMSAPYRLDCALTYNVSVGASADVAPVKRVTRELTTQEWTTVLQNAWQAGIPHVIFTGGEPTLREDLSQLISVAEANGQVSGLLTDGLRLADKAYLDTLLQTGLDHLLIVLQPENKSAWQAIQNATAGDIFTAVHLTLTPKIQAEVPNILNRLVEAKVNALSLSANSPEMTSSLQQARELAAQLNLNLVWDLPVPYSVANPITSELEAKEVIDGAGKAWLYVEPDGDVLPAQGINQVLGNILTDPWDKIYKKQSR